LGLWRLGVLGFLDLGYEVFCWFMGLGFWVFRLLGLGVFGFLGFLQGLPKKKFGEFF